MKEWKLKIFILPLVLCLVRTADAAELKGKISDTDGNPVDFASVRICATDSTLIAGAVTDENGIYNISGLPECEIRVNASCIGYNSTSAELMLSNIHPIICDLVLTESTNTLQELTVTSERFVRTRNGVTVIPDREQKKHASSGYELVRNLMIPGVTVDAFKGSVSALGGKVSLYIDGMEADEREVRQLRPDDVERVQYIDAPTGRYAGDNVALNFILRKRTSGGYVSLDALQRIGYTAGDYNLAAKYYDRNTQYTLFSGTDYKKIQGSESERDENIRFPDGTINRHYTTIAEINKKNSQYGQLRIRNKNEHRTLRATLNIVHNATPEGYNESLLKYSGLSSVAAEVSAERSERSRGMKYSLGLSGTFNLPNQQSIDASASASVSKNRYDYNYKENVSAVNSSTSENLYNFHASLNYVKDFRHGNSLTIKLYELYNVSSADYNGTHSSWQHLWMSESLIFAEYMQPLWKIASLRVSPGFSAQAYRLHGRETIGNYSPRAQAVFTIQPARGQFAQIGGAYGNSYPQLAMITDAVTQVDMLQQRRGNPDLKQTRITQAMAVYSLGIGKVNFQLMALYMGASRLPLVSYSIEDGMLVQSFRGDGRWDQATPTLSATWMPSKRLNIQLSGGWMYNSYDGNGSRMSAACWTAEARAAYYIGDFAINAYMSTPKKIMGYDLVSTRTIWDFGLSGSWSHKGLRIEAGFHNPFYRRPRYRMTLDCPEYSFDNTQYATSDRQSAWVKTSWSIDFGKKIKHDTQNVDKNIDSGILRAR